ncbi:hypothetical protein KCU73_g10895, partial [Aureobasidium melanogenum]
ATTSSLFSAATALAIELRNTVDDSDTSYAKVIDKCLAFFESIQDQDMLAGQAKTLVADRNCKTYSSRDSHVVTHRSTNLPFNCLCMAERTGCPVFS